jgi:formylglycine-generating enzyme required for sulfatase activity
VGQKLPNPWGLFDMHGNVWEWCGDWFAADYYAKSAAADPLGPDTGTMRVLRGSSWCDGEPGCFRCAYRYQGRAPDFRDFSLGFRVARDLPDR